MSDFPNNSALKNFARRDQGPKRLHILVLSADGQTRRLSFSPSFFWILGILSILVLGALAFLTHQFFELTLERDSLDSKLHNVTKYNQLRTYKETVSMAPEEARRILEILDRAIVMSESDDSEVGLIGVPEPSPPVTENPDDQTAAANQNVATEEPLPSQETPVTAPPAKENTPVNSDDSLQAAWQAWHTATGEVTDPNSLDISDFEVSPKGSVTFFIRQDGEPGQRVKGRVLVVLAISEANGKISLVSAPPTDLTKPEQGWELGSKYNIIASKLVRAQANIPDGAKIVNAEVSSWEEETKELVFRKKILIEDQ
ncbi:MAG: hypothetical protein LBE80_07650 [Deltaproteobacteria bacterium]|nr:hypothetical protein [Deltaproteobacteria bacterium]